MDATLKRQLKNKLAERLEQPHLPSAKLSGEKNLYKIKSRQSGYRLVYKVDDNTVTVTVVTVGKRERNEVYRKAIARLTS